jgi:hypothetical protein
MAPGAVEAFTAWLLGLNEKQRKLAVAYPPMSWVVLPSGAPAAEDDVSAFAPLPPGAMAWVAGYQQDGLAIGLKTTVGADLILQHWCPLDRRPQVIEYLEGWTPADLASLFRGSRPMLS